MMHTWLVNSFTKSSKFTGRPPPIWRLKSTLKMSFPLLFSKLDEQMPCLPPPSSEAVAALVRELRVQLGMVLFGVDAIINIHTHTLTVIDINIFPGTAAVQTHVQTRTVTEMF